MMMMKVLIVLLVVAPFQAVYGYEEPAYFPFYQEMLGSNVLKQCQKRSLPPHSGSKCPRKPKSCLWGSQKCSTSISTREEPTIRCNCDEEKWSCQSFDCPTMTEPAACPEVDPSSSDGELSPVCIADMTCGYDEQTCCGKTYPKKFCTCEAGTTFNCQEVDLCASSDCSMIEADHLHTVQNLTKAFKPDLCTLPAEAGPCRALFKRWYFDGMSCQKFDYGGCLGNDNNFASEADCENRCGTPTCELPPDVGPCDAAIPRWHYDGATGECKEFDWGGCGGNGNKFLTFQECKSDCCSKEDGSCGDICALPQEVGPCEAAIPRWSFNTETQVCEEFIYGGCGGNKNNFASQLACESDCCKDGKCEEKDICTLPQVVGPCEAAIPRWSFNTDTQTCEQFTYGGCEGNGNNFISQSACESDCCKDGKCEPDVCSLPKEVGPCIGKSRRWFFNSESGICEKFTYGGCQGNDNNFESESDCESGCCEGSKCERDICGLPADVGPCDAVVRRWFFNANTGMCERFTYGGCDGNDNNFPTKSQCERRCCEDSGTCGSICELPAEVGNCDATIPRWFFNSKSGACERFVYGGCGGNDNNFSSKSNCESGCCEGKTCVDICKLPAAVGPCDAALPRWYMDARTGVCHEFTYGGCGGNGNNFESSKECQQQCCSGPACAEKALDSLRGDNN